MPSASPGVPPAQAAGPATPDWLDRFRALERVLSDHDHLWRPAPFHERRPDWCRRHPELAAAALALSGAEVAALGADNAALIDWVSRYLPELAVLQGLIALPRRVPPPEGPTGRLACHVPGRKQAQAVAFAEGIGEPGHDILEWCSGKGHLGRLLAARWGASLLSLDHDPSLCAEGEILAGRAGTAQRFVCADALDPASARYIQGRHAVALHACGDLHLALLRGAVAQGAAALDLSPCCYYRTASPRYVPLDPEARLELSRDELHLAVTDTMTAGARELGQRDRGMAWKLAFLALHADLTGEAAPFHFKPVPAAWFALGFEAWIRRLADREGLTLPGALDWAGYEQLGWQRQQEVMRLGLIRQAFRRPLELWLVLDRALFLERAGYTVRVAEFCDRALTPRNLLISARR